MKIAKYDSVIHSSFPKWSQDSVGEAATRRNWWKQLLTTQLSCYCAGQTTAHFMKVPIVSPHCTAANSSALFAAG